MKLSSKQQKALDQLAHYISLSPACQRPCNDAGFLRSIGTPKKQYTGNPVSGEQAYFLHTDRGLGITRETCHDYDRYKQLMIAHRLFSLTVSMWREDMRKGNLLWTELTEFPEVQGTLRNDPYCAGCKSS